MAKSPTRRARVARDSGKTDKEVAEMIAAFAQMRTQMQLLLQGGVPGAAPICLSCASALFCMLMARACSLCAAAAGRDARCCTHVLGYWLGSMLLAACWSQGCALCQELRQGGLQAWAWVA